MGGAPSFWGPGAAAQLDPPQGRAYYCNRSGVSLISTLQKQCCIVYLRKVTDKLIDRAETLADRRFGPVSGKRKVSGCECLMTDELRILKQFRRTMGASSLQARLILLLRLLL